MTIKVKRVYETIRKDDGKRILVDRVWPRGISKENLQLDNWLKELAPSTSLRKWFQHDPDKYQTFKQKYQTELKEDSEKQEALKELKDVIRSNDNVTLLYAAKDEQHNQALVLKEELENIN
ncbi:MULTISPECIES: DUF488 domain-containing protein [Paraliobacillus]|uniref:DUF488 domain-containing protein n=1 Tax=Paraliobacillus TaxID=200903 RepID=UPI000DD4248B|nr:MULTISPECIES: DUF488 domain-containing protein [Paraliobacillus]